MKIYEEFELPSNGIIYPMHRGRIGECEGIEELERTTPTSNQDIIICGIMQKCLEKAFNVDELVLPDYTYLQIRARVATYGRQYRYPIACPFCGTVHEYVDLNSLDIKMLDREKWQTQRVIKIPQSNDITDKNGDEISIRLPSIREREEVNSDSSIQHSNIMKVVYAIDTINGTKTNSIEKEKYVMELSTAQKRAILSSVDKLANFGVALIQHFTCEQCHKDVSYPFHCRTAQFWIPTVD